MLKIAKSMFLIVGLIMLVIAGLAIYDEWNRNRIESSRPHGNDRESIIEMIRSTNGFENSTVEILKIEDIGEFRFVGFLADNHPGGISFTKDQKGKYRLDRTEINNSGSLELFLPYTYPSFMVITSQKNKVAKIKININGQEIEHKLEPNKKTVSWIEFPEQQGGRYSFRDYRYYDAEGKLIE